MRDNDVPVGPRLAGPRLYDLAAQHVDFPPWGGAPRSTLLICTQQRSGSTLLGEAIYFGRTLGCPLEYFCGGFRPSFEARWPATDTRSYVAALHRYRTDPAGVFSAKLFWPDVVELARDLAPDACDWLPAADPQRTDDASYRRIFATIAGLFPQPTFVYLTRQDEIRQAVSWSVAGQTGSWRRFTDRAEDVDRQQPVYNFHEIVQRLADIQHDTAHWTNFFRANALPYHEIRYEDLAGDCDRTLRRFFDAIGRSDVPVTPPRLRRQGGSRSDQFVGEFLAEFGERARG